MWPGGQRGLPSLALLSAPSGMGTEDRAIRSGPTEQARHTRVSVWQAEMDRCPAGDACGPGRSATPGGRPWACELCAPSGTPCPGGRHARVTVLADGAWRLGRSPSLCWAGQVVDQKAGAGVPRVPRPQEPDRNGGGGLEQGGRAWNPRTWAGHPVPPRAPLPCTSLLHPTRPHLQSRPHSCSCAHRQ